MNENIPSVVELEVQAKAWFEEEHDYDCPWKDVASFAHHILTSQTQRGTDRVCECECHSGNMERACVGFEVEGLNIAPWNAEK